MTRTYRMSCLGCLFWIVVGMVVLTASAAFCVALFHVLVAMVSG